MYLVVALLSYFFTALANTLDKFLLSSRKIPAPSVYAFYTGILGIVSLVFIPLDFSLPNFTVVLLSLSSGIAFLYAIFIFYLAIKRGETSKVAPLSGVSLGVATFIISFLLDELFSTYQYFGISLLIIGGLVISLADKKNEKTFARGAGYAIISGAVLAASLTLFKLIYQEESFINGFLWTRFGLILGSISLLAVPVWRKEIFKVLKGFKKETKKHVSSLGWVILNKGIGGAGSILLNLAISMGSVVVVNSMASTQYAFVFILSSALSLKKPQIFEEELKKKALIKKIIGILIISAGVVLVSLP